MVSAGSGSRGAYAEDGWSATLWRGAARLVGLVGRAELSRDFNIQFYRGGLDLR